MPERRKHPRIDLAAQVELSSSDVVHLLRAKNASRGGLFLPANPDNYPQFREGAEVDIQICEVEPPEGSDREAIDVEARARIVRVEADEDGGFALEFLELDDENQARLDELLKRGA